MIAFRYSSYSRPISKNVAFILKRFYAAPSKGAAAAAAKVLPTQPPDDQSFIDMDTEKLTKYCCCNYLKDGADVPLKSDSEYPSWLFKLRLGPPPTLDELDPADLAYWERYNEFALRERLERRQHFFVSSYTQHWLRDVKKIPEEDIKGDVTEFGDDKFARLAPKA